MKILVLGAGGMAGHVISLYLRESGHQVDTLSANNSLDQKTILLDVRQQDKLAELLKSGQYDAVVNCIGILVKQSESRKDLASYLNAYLPHFLEEFYKDTTTKVIHLSTDCVFSGKNAPYKEDSAYDGEVFYDRSKALGEIINDKDLTFRMSIIGPDMMESGIGLFNWFFEQSGDITGYTTAIWSGITTIELAKGIEAALQQNLSGLYHLVPDGNISKFELLNLFKEVFDRQDITITPKEVDNIDKTLLNTRRDFNFKVLDYKPMIEEMKAWITNHESYYKHYKRGI
jgi:dTDP-4-dehydrorhamnose reductase